MMEVSCKSCMMAQIKTCAESKTLQAALQFISTVIRERKDCSLAKYTCAS